MTRSHAGLSSLRVSVSSPPRAGLELSWVGCLCPGDVVGGCKLLRNRYDSRDREWATYTCVLGFHVYGEQGLGTLREGWGGRGQGGARPGLGMRGMCRGVGVQKPADLAGEAPQALGCRDWEGLPGTRPVGGRGCLSAGNGAALGRGWPRGEASLRRAAVLGVWPDGSDGTDINSLCRSHNERVVAVADDFCKVHLFQYPCARAKVRPPGASGAGRAG